MNSHTSADGASLDQAMRWMTECIRLAREAAQSQNYALGALVVRDGAVLARSASRLISSNDPSAHPEMVAIRGAAETVGSRYLQRAYLVSTLEPCVMCTGVAIWAKMSGIIFGAYRSDAIGWARRNPSQRFTWRQIQISCQDVVDKGEPRLDVVGGVLRSACKALFELNPATNES